MTPHIAVLVNPAAGRGRAVRVAEFAVQRLHELGAEVRVFSGDSEQATRLLAAAALAENPAAWQPSARPRDRRLRSRSAAGCGRSTRVSLSARMVARAS